MSKVDKSEYEFVSKANVHRDKKNITIIPYYQNHDWEEITLRKASRNLACSECNRIIKRGEKYIRDKFKYTLNSPYVFENWFKYKTNFICLNCWKGQIPEAIATNRK